MLNVTERLVTRGCHADGKDRKGCALLIAATVRGNGDLLGELMPSVKHIDEWREKHGEECDSLLITLIDEARRHQEARTVLAGLFETRQGMVGFLRDLQQVDLVCGTTKGESLDRFPLAEPLVQKKVTLPGVLISREAMLAEWELRGKHTTLPRWPLLQKQAQDLPKEIVARIIGNFHENRGLVSMVAQVWTGGGWRHFAENGPSVLLCIASPPVAEGVLRSSGLPLTV